jgi:glycogen debranching enzyme
MKDIREEAYQKAVQVLETCDRKTGLYASGLKGGYEATWSRDSNITALGASLVSKKFKNGIKKSLILLSKNQSDLGQIPNCVGSYNIDRRSDVTFNSIDSSLWYIIGHYVYASAYDDTSLLEKYSKNIQKTIDWLLAQDPNEDKLLAQQPTMDWMDAFPHKYGHVLNTQALHYIVLKMTGRDKEAKHIKDVLNGKTERYLTLYDKKRGYYLPWNWKNHDGDREQEEWFDSLGNLLAIVGGLANNKIANSILDYIEKEEVNKPAPCKAIWPPIKKGDKEWKSYFSKCDARTPYNYLNGGVWLFIGGFYVAALVKMKRFKKAEEELESLAKANLKAIEIRDLKGKYEFNEWVHGKNGRAMGEPYQAWSAGMYVFAYECVANKKVIYFK